MRYHTSRQQVQRWRKRYDGTVQSLAHKSRRPHSHPNQHTQEELDLIKQKHRYHRHEGLAQVYRKLKNVGYTRTYDSICRQIRKVKLNKPKKQKRSYPKSKYRKVVATYPGERVQIDVKYVPIECISFANHHSRYYQITAVDEYSVKRHMALVEEHSTYTTSQFLKGLEDNLEFSIDLVQTDNGLEFVNDPDKTAKKSRFQKTLEEMNIKHHRIRPYSPWQNRIVEHSHRINNELFYNKRRFKNFEEMLKAFKRYSNRYNNISQENFLILNRQIKWFMNTSLRMLLNMILLIIN